MRLVCLCALGVAAVFSGTAPAAGAACANEAIRVQQDAGDLPDCGAWEQVSPVDKNNGDVNPVKGNTQASLDGQRVVFTSEGSFAGSASSILNNQYYAARGAGGWTTKAIMPPQNPAVGSALTFNRSAFLRFSPDLRWSALISSGLPMAPGAQTAAHTVYTRDNETDQYTTISAAAPEGIIGALLYRPAFVDASDDHSRVFFASNHPQTPEVPEDFVPRIYEWHNGTVRLASLTPSGEVPTGEVLAGAAVTSFPFDDTRETQEAVSADGSRLFFETEGEVYVAEGGPSRKVSASQRTEPDPAGDLPAKFAAASEDGRYVFFLSAEKLTDDATTSPTGAGQDLYRYDVETEELIDLTVKTTSNPNELHGAAVTHVAGTSDDGEYVYFAATSQLIPGVGAGNEPNLYLWHAGELSHVAEGPTLVRNFTSQGWRTSRVTPDGKHLYFTTDSPVLFPQANGTEQAYVYDAEADQAECISCPDGPPALQPGQKGEVFLRTGPLYIGTSFVEPYSYSQYPGHFLSDDGSTAYFHTLDALVPGDVNGQLDVYRWRDGEVSLVSSGRGAASYFADATPDGREAFFVTANQLVGWDRDQTQDLYAAMPGGGFPEPVEAPPACVGDGCQGKPAVAPPSPPGASEALSRPSSKRCRAAKKPGKRGKPTRQGRGKQSQNAKGQRAKRPTSRGCRGGAK